MMTWRRAIELSIGEDDLAQLVSIARSRTEPAIRAERARICWPTGKTRPSLRWVNLWARVSRRWFSPRDASLPSFVSWQARFPALRGTMKAIRLPTRLSAVAHWSAPAAHPIPPAFVSAVAHPEGRRSFQPRTLGWPAARLSGGLRMDANGFSQVLRRSFLRLCSTPGLWSNRRALATHGHLGAAPAG